MTVLIYDKVSMQHIGIEKKMSNNTNFSECLVEGWTFHLKKKNESFVLKKVSRRLRQMIPMILLYVMTMLTKLFYILTAAFCEGNWSD